MIKLKFLRKYNRWILVVGGVLLMVAWLLPQALMELGKTRLGVAVMRVDGHKVSTSAFERPYREFLVLERLIPRGLFSNTAGGLGVEGPEHWYLLVKEAEEGGYLSGAEHGRTYIPELGRTVVELLLSQLSPFQQPPADQVQMLAEQVTGQIEGGVEPLAAETHQTPEAVYEALGKLHGVIRMREAYFRAPRFSDRRMISAAKRATDTASVDYVFVSADRYAQDVPNPTDEELQAHFEKYKAAKPGDGEFGVGYLQPDRVKLAWLTLSRPAVQEAVTPDPVEVRKRYLRKYPNDRLPEGLTAEQAQSEIEAEVEAEQVDKVMKSAEQAVRAEIDRSLRRLEQSGQYRVLPADWAAQRPDLTKIAQTAAQRVKDATGVEIPAPKVEVRDAFMPVTELRNLEGFGGAVLSRGNQQVSSAELVGRVRELNGDNQEALQVGVPYAETLADFSGNRYFFTVLDARKSSAPDSLAEVREQAIADWKRVQGYKTLQQREAELRELAASQGIEALSQSLSAPATSGQVQVTFPVQVRKVTVSKVGVSPADENINTEAFRDAVRSTAATLDPAVDLATTDAAPRTLSVPLPSKLGLVVAQVTAASPLTQERFRTAQNNLAFRLSLEELRDEKTTPFTLDRMKERHKVEDMRPKKEDADQPAAG